jgi:MarR-like DNA-binding transcriptional regulator SgrR of sgrS sRNA
MTKPTRRSRFSVRIIGVLGLIIILIPACAHFGYELRKKPSIEHIAHIQRAEDELMQSVYRLLSLEPSADPHAYELARAEFDSLLAQYLRLDHTKNGEKLSITRSGTTILLPVHVADTVSEMVYLSPQDRPRILWENIGPVFHGEILDMTIVADDSSDTAALILLFEDSLVTVDMSKDPAAIENIYRFPESMTQHVRPQFPCGQFLPGEGFHYVDQFFLTNRLKAIINGIGEVHPREANGIGHENNFAEALLNIRSVPGRCFFESEKLPDMQIRSIRFIGEDASAVLLDREGYVVMYQKNNPRPVWRSDRSWGNRLFKLSTETIAVSYTGEKSFVVFGKNSDTLSLLGQSPNFEGTVSAVYPFSRSGGDGVLVAVSHSNARGMRTGRLQFVPFELFEYNPSVIYDIPRFPDYELEMIFVKGRDAFRVPEYAYRTLPEAVFSNVYETLFKMDSDGSPVPQIANWIKSDSTHRVWKVGLRGDIVFSDGSALTAQAIVESMNRNKNICLESGCPDTWLWNLLPPDISVESDSIDFKPGVFSAGQDTIIFNFSNPVHNVPELLTYPCFHVNKAGNDGVWPIGTGPYQIVETSSRVSPVHIRLSRNEYYRFGMPPVKEVRFIFNRADIIEFTTANPKVMTTVRRHKDVNFFREHPRHHIAEFPGQSIYFLAFNPVSSVLSDLNARRRITDLVDRTVLANIVNEAESVPAGQFTGGLSFDPQPDSATGRGRITQPLRIYYFDRDQVAQQIAERLGALLAQANIPYRRPEGLTANILDGARRNGRYDIIVDSFEPHFRSQAYSMFHLLSRGYRLDPDIDPNNNADILNGSPAELRQLERTLIERMYLYPILRTKNYAVLPYELNGIFLQGHESIDISRSWIPQ